jgi:hypothetical protein
MLIVLPIKGVYRGVPIANLPPGYSGSMNNVRPRDVSEGRIRIGQRPGLDKWGAGDQVGGSEQPIVSMVIVSSVQ